MINWYQHKQNLSEVSPTMVETADLKRALDGMLDDMTHNEFADPTVRVTKLEADVVGLLGTVTALTKRVEKLTERERTMDEGSTPQEIRPAAHRALDRIEGHPDGGGDGT